MSGVFTVTEAAPEDGSVVGEIHAESWQAVYAKFFSPEFAAEAVGHRRGKWRDVLLEKRDTVMLGALDGRPLAFTYFGASPAPPDARSHWSRAGHTSARLRKWRSVVSW
ncbi:hypothetical protein AB0C10_37200 [Microbispora amethystogenes]|uniref:hypothetical protein n=1 Tax=Microbispora amethystogenes TaxID=1427754 RepID=UPI00340C7F3E